MFNLDTFKLVGPRTSFNFHPDVLSALPCGLFRTTLQEGAALIPEFAELLASCPVDNIDEYEFDIKVHMLMPNQFPCVPNWHCDNVPRGQFTGLNYPEAARRGGPPMLLWISNGPHTEFLAKPMEMPYTPDDHLEVADFIHAHIQCGHEPVTRVLPSQQWAEFSSLAPHRGVASEEHQWRVFVRATHKSVLPDRPKVHPVRRHCQVYLDTSSFAW
jgi:hypothetical protein